MSRQLPLYAILGFILASGIPTNALAVRDENFHKPTKIPAQFVDEVNIPPFIREPTETEKQELIKLETDIHKALKSKDQNIFEDLFNKIQTIELSTYGPMHPYNANNYFLLFYHHNMKGDYKKASEYQKKGIEILEKTLNGDHPILARHYNNLATFFIHEKNYDEAESYLLKANFIIEKSLGSKHIRASSILNNLASIYLDIKNYDKAEFYIKKSIQTIEYNKGINDESLENPLMNLATLHQDQGNVYEAEINIKRIIQILEQKYGKKSPKLLNVLRYYSAFFINQGKFDQSISLSERCLNISNLNFGKNDFKNVMYMRDIAHTQILNNKDLDSAANLLKESIKIREANHKNNNSWEYAYDLIALSFVEVELKNFDSAETFMQLCFKVMNEDENFDPNLKLNFYERVAEYYFSQKKYKESKMYYNYMLEIITSNPDDNKNQIDKIKSSLLKMDLITNNK